MGILRFACVETGTVGLDSRLGWEAFGLVDSCVSGIRSGWDGNGREDICPPIEESLVDASCALEFSTACTMKINDQETVAAELRKFQFMLNPTTFSPNLPFFTCLIRKGNRRSRLYGRFRNEEMLQVSEEI
jgi:hypothetical protein